MPGDTPIIANARDSLRLPDSLNQLQATFPGKPDTGNGTGVFIILLAAGILFLIIRYRRKYLQEQAYKAVQSNFTQYDEWLATYNEYYKSLPLYMRQRFLERVAWFITTKTFNALNLPLEDKMPLLISAASVQITFGLDKYLLDFFDTIYIMQHNYNYGLYNMPFEGHVNSNGIYLSWDNFLRGFENYADADNVGIHEMAHALAYVNFMAGANDGQDEAFIKRFYNFSAVARPIFNDMQQGKRNLLNEYAGTNYNEFWAVAVETFFEKSLHMKVEMPDLYIAMCSLLNQDPLVPEKLITLL
jgi:Mlc titration factor MtfA (ptsG expression regulator)